MVSRFYIGLFIQNIKRLVYTILVPHRVHKCFLFQWAFPGGWLFVIWGELTSIHLYVLYRILWTESYPCFQKRKVICLITSLSLPLCMLLSFLVARMYVIILSCSLLFVIIFVLSFSCLSWLDCFRYKTRCWSCFLSLCILDLNILPWIKHLMHDCLTLCAVSTTRGSAKKNSIGKNGVAKIIDEAYRCKF